MSRIEAPWPPLLELEHEVENLRLDRDVERRRRLVGDQQVGVQHERHGDHHALAHPARQMMRILRHAPFGVGDADLGQHGHGAPRCLVARHCLVLEDHLRQLHADREHRIQRRHRLLEDHADRAAADLAHLLPRQREQVLALQRDLAGDDAARRARDETQHAQRRDAFAGAGLADEPEHFAGAHVEVDAVDGFGHAGLGIEVGAQPANGE